MARPYIFEMRSDGNGPKRKILADWATLVDRDASEEFDLWEFESVVIWNYNPKTGQVGRDALALKRRTMELPKHLDKLLGRDKKPGEMNFVELHGLIDILRTVGEDTRIYATDFHHKIAFPFASLILILIGYTISVRAHARSMVVAFSYGLAFGILYILVDAVCLKLGHSGLLSPWVGGWFPNILFCLLAVYRMHYVNLVRD
jgi:lipopolysaccharide export system permease protein